MSRSSLGSYVAQHSNILELSENGELLYCYICELSFQCNRKRDIDRHINSKKHITSKTHIDNLQSSSDSEFYSELCEAFVSANIPLHKLHNLKKFLEKYCDRNIPGESNLRKHYVSAMFENKMDEIRYAVKDTFLWVNVEETTDIQGHSIGNVIVGTLHDDTPTSHYLVASKILEKADSETIFSLVCNSLDNIIREKSSKVLLLVTDATSHMLKAGNQLSEELPQMIHVTYLNRALQRICEYIRKEFTDVDKFFNEIKKVFLKSPKYQKLFKQMCPQLKLPPQPELIRWDTWLEVATYYSNNFNDIQRVVLNLESTTNGIAELKELIKRPHLSAQLNLIIEDFGYIPLAIKQLETQDISLPDALDIFNNTIKKLKVSGTLQQRLEQHVKNVTVKQNPGFTKICEISTALKNENASEDLFQYYRYAPVASCNIEHSFSLFKKGCSPRRHFTSNNMEKYFIIYYNNRCDT